MRWPKTDAYVQQLPGGWDAYPAHVQTLPAPLRTPEAYCVALVWALMETMSGAAAFGGSSTQATYAIRWT
jgi:hypothetical protein